MPELTDVMPALVSFQEELSAGRLQPAPSHAETDPKLRLFTDLANGEWRITYSRIDDDGTVTAFLSVCESEPLDGLRCLGVGYAVPEDLRGQGRATEILTAVIAELSHGFLKAGQKGLCVEAVVGEDNPASQAVARKVLSDTPSEITDGISGLPALRYVRKIEL